MPQAPASTPNPWLELRVIREKDGHSLSSLARASGLSVGYISDLEKGRRKPNPRVIGVLADTLNVPRSVLEPHRRYDLPPGGAA